MSFPKYMTMKYRNFSVGSNPLRLPLVRASAARIACLTQFRGRVKHAHPLLCGGWEGFESVMIYGKLNNFQVRKSPLPPFLKVGNQMNF